MVKLINIFFSLFIFYSCSGQLLAQELDKSQRIDRTRYLTSSSAFQLKKGDSYYQNNLLLLNSYHIGITDYISVGGGIEFVSPLLTEEFRPYIFLTAKSSFQVVTNFRAGASFSFLFNTDFTATNTRVGLTNVILTYGTEKFNFTASTGWGFLKYEIEKRPNFTLSGMAYFTKKFALVTENRLLPTNIGYYGLFSYGIRYSMKRLTFDIALFNNKDFKDMLPVGLPYFDLIVKF
jgi:hypothetical protein